MILKSMLFALFFRMIASAGLLAASNTGLKSVGAMEPRM
jgi:hypothetical protein